MQSTVMRLKRLLTSVYESYWFVPLLFVTLALAVAMVSIRADRALFALGDAERLAPYAIALFSSIAGAIISLTGLVFTMTMIVLQLAQQSLSPRLLRHFIRDGRSQRTLGILLGTFVTSLLGLAQAIAYPNDETLPVITLSLASVLALASLVALLRYINHVAESVRAPAVIRMLTTEGLAVVDRIFPEDATYIDAAEPIEPPHRHAELLLTDIARGEIAGFDRAGLLEAARAASVTVVFRAGVGDHVGPGSVFAEIHGQNAEAVVEQLRSLVDIEQERSYVRDLGFVLRQLVDISLRAMSPAVNDPMTATQAIHGMGDILGVLAERDLPSGSITDEWGTLRVQIPEPTWRDYLGAALVEVWAVGHESPLLGRTVNRLLSDLERSTDGKHAEAVRAIRDQLRDIGGSAVIAEAEGAAAD